MFLELAIFYFAAIVAIGGAVMMIVQRNPVASVLFMVVSLVAQAILYVQLSAMFLGAILIIVYAGAILVLFLFVVMLLNLRGEKFTGQTTTLGKSLKIGFGLLIFAELGILIKQLASSGAATAQSVADLTEFGSVEAVASKLFRDFLYPFELTSILLLVAIVGAVVLAKRDKDETEDEEDN